MEVLKSIKDCHDFDSIKVVLSELNLNVRKYDNLDLFLIKYHRDADNMDNEDVQKCRGLIANLKGDLVCLPPIKSMELIPFMDTLGDGETLETNVSIEEFVDGTMINLFYYGESWHISTRSNIGANCRWYSKKHFSELFAESSSLDFETLDKETTYSFVLKHPENRIVTAYSEPSITLVSARKIVDKVVVDCDIYQLNEKLNVAVPIKYEFDNLEDIIKYVQSQDYQFQGVVLKNGMYRTKIINSNYNYAKNLRGNSQNTKFLYFDLRQKQIVQEYLRFFPEFREMFESYNKEYLDLLNKIFHSYQNYHVKKQFKNIKDMDFVSRPFCYELHGEHIKNKIIVTRPFVLNYMNNVPPARIVFALNHRPAERAV